MNFLKSLLCIFLISLIASVVLLEGIITGETSQKKEESPKIKTTRVIPKLTQKEKDEFQFRTKGMNFIFKWEKKVCHKHSKDPGGLTCFGFSERSHGKLLVKLMNQFFLNCKKSHSNFLTCKHEAFDATLKKEYVKHYYKPFEACGWPNAFPLANATVLSGKRQAVKALQRASGLKVDGIIGPNTKKACQSFNEFSSRFFEKRRAFYRGLKNCKTFCRGWIRRVNSAEEAYESFVKSIN